MFARTRTAAAIAILVGSSAHGQATVRVNVSTGGVQANSLSLVPEISADGRYVAFWSGASNLVPGDANGIDDVFVRDRLSGTTELVSVSTGGAQGDGPSGFYGGLSISADGRYVAFESFATNLVAGDTNGQHDIFVRDRQLGTTVRVSISTGKAQGDDLSIHPSISADGRFVAFESWASNLIAGDVNGYADIFVHDLPSGTTQLVSVASSGEQGNFPSEDPSISADGRYVAFMSMASNFAAGDNPWSADIFVRDRQNATTELVGAQPNSGRESPAISADGRYVAFESLASLVANDTNGMYDVYVHDRQSGTSERVSISTGGVQGNLGAYNPSVSADGRFVAFAGDSWRLVAGDTNNRSDVFLRDRVSGTTERVSVGNGDTQGSNGSYDSAISADGRHVAFGSLASNLVAGDTNGWDDVFVRDREADGFTSLCEPGSGSVAPCPCSNPPAGPGRGCENSSATGGASLSASGVAYLSMDSLVFTTSGEKPTALSVVLQGTTVIASGTVYGQGLRCVGGTLKRLYAKQAAGGSITAPDFGLGDMSVSAVSAALGNPISAGQTRSYLVFYRDPVVLGGCPAARTFNATQTGSVTWWP